MIDKVRFPDMNIRYDELKKRKYCSLYLTTGTLVPWYT